MLSELLPCLLQRRSLGGTIKVRRRRYSGSCGCLVSFPEFQKLEIHKAVSDFSVEVCVQNSALPDITLQIVLHNKAFRNVVEYS